MTSIVSIITNFVVLEQKALVLMNLDNFGQAGTNFSLNHLISVDSCTGLVRCLHPFA